MYARRGPQTPFRVRPQETAQCNLHFQEKAKVKATKCNFIFLPNKLNFLTLHYFWRENSKPKRCKDQQYCNALGIPSNKVSIL